MREIEAIHRECEDLMKALEKKEGLLGPISRFLHEVHCGIYEISARDLDKRSLFKCLALLGRREEAMDVIRSIMAHPDADRIKKYAALSAAYEVEYLIPDLRRELNSENLLSLVDDLETRESVRRKTSKDGIMIL